ncbi:flippase-like domain-containing protein [Salinarchaeum sp. IM2453]|uniref:lysylphosphatidylglycerol synthase transmembrane domain-containing protein n=1 Tax=Salinarchaeum sp. IM2453 TaxID=2862870 RepID=UPI001C838BFE|nr:lysylphosphatidylglycerol synthase transmembrane domain-containing protein [Salinarchaeum sp. IM2453]QZA87749.1 flippase-like domain-containing protein [Salinarchaeum sp. IM2453]
MRQKAVLWVVGAAILVGGILIAGWAEIVETAQMLAWYELLILLGLQIITIAGLAYQWGYLFKRSGKSIRYRDIAIVNLASGFVESVTPSSKLGGEAAKVYLFHQITNTAYHRLSALLLVQKFVSLGPLFVICVVSTLFFVNYADVTVQLETNVVLGPILATIIVLLIGYLLIRFRDRLLVDKEYSIPHIDEAQRFLQSSIRNARSLLTYSEQAWMLSVSTGVWALYPFKVYLAAQFLSLELSLFIAVVGTFLAYGVSLLPVSPGGLGTFEATLASVCVIGGLTFSEGMAVALVTRVATFWFPLALSAGATVWLFVSDEQISPEETRVDSWFQ